MKQLSYSLAALLFCMAPAHACQPPYPDEFKFSTVVQDPKEVERFHRESWKKLFDKSTIVVVGKVKITGQRFPKDSMDWAQDAALDVRKVLKSPAPTGWWARMFGKQDLSNPLHIKGINHGCSPFPRVDDGSMAFVMLSEGNYVHTAIPLSDKNWLDEIKRYVPGPPIVQKK